MTIQSIIENPARLNEKSLWALYRAAVEVGEKATLNVINDKCTNFSQTIDPFIDQIKPLSLTFDNDKDVGGFLAKITRRELFDHFIDYGIDAGIYDKNLNENLAESVSADRKFYRNCARKLVPLILTRDN